MQSNQQSQPLPNTSKDESFSGGFLRSDEWELNLIQETLLERRLLVGNLTLDREF